jgi:LPS sulfotransferase NodH
MPDVSTVGYKLMYDQAKKFEMVLEYMKKKDVHVIHIVRNNVLKTLISMMSARKRRLFHTTASVKVEKVYISTRLILRKLQKIQKQNTFWEKLMSDQFSNYLKILYEDLMYKDNEEIKKMLLFLNVDINVKLRSQLHKINPDKIENVILNYDKIEKILYKSRFKYCLEK